MFGVPRNVARARGFVRARFGGSEEEKAALLSRLMRDGRILTEFTFERPTLEDVFLDLTEMRETA